MQQADQVEEDLGGPAAFETRGGTHLSDIRVNAPRVNADPDLISGD